MESAADTVDKQLLRHNVPPSVWVEMDKESGTNEDCNSTGMFSIKNRV